MEDFINKNIPDMVFEDITQNEKEPVIISDSSDKISFEIDTDELIDTSTILNVTDIIDTEYIVGMMDILMPTLMVLTLKTVFKTQAEKRAFELTAKDKRAITGSMEKVLKMMNLRFDNPVTELMVILSAIYGAKTIDVYAHNSSNNAVSTAENPVTYSSNGKKIGRPRKK